MTTQPMLVPTDTLTGDDYLAAYFEVSRANGQSVWIACHTRNHEIVGRVDRVEREADNEYTVAVAALDEGGELRRYHYVRFDEIEDYGLVVNRPSAQDYARGTSLRITLHDGTLIVVNLGAGHVEVTGPEPAPRVRLRDRLRGWLLGTVSRSTDRRES